MTEHTSRAVERSEKSAPGFLYFLMGAGLGTLITLLTAPQSGRETRSSMAQKARDAEDYAHRVQGRVGSLIEQSMETVRDKVQQVSEAVDAGRETYRQEIARGKASGN